MGGSVSDREAQIGEQQMLDVARGEVVQKPTFKEALPVILSLQTLNQAACYFCSFGAELAINSSLGPYYLKNFPSYGQTGTGRWAAMFGLLNVVTRPLGGILSDLIYRQNKNLWLKKAWIHVCGFVTGAFLLAIGFKDSHDPNTMFGLIGGMAVFLEAGNGANFSLVPHVHPHANGEFAFHRYRSRDSNESVQVLSPVSQVVSATLVASSSPSSSGTPRPTTVARSGSLAS